MDYTHLSDSELLSLLNQTSTIAKHNYRQKKELEEEHRRRFMPAGAAALQPTEEAPGGLTMKQISQIRKWAKDRHNTEDLIKFITLLIIESETN